MTDGISILIIAKSMPKTKKMTAKTKKLAAISLVYVVSLLLVYFA